ncbi:MAG: mechanosensitive ion channel [Thermodesulfovibrionales bacterium]|nr:mechanosensitive ion channel [Thermodesulfovibrionales bacterium]
MEELLKIVSITGSPAVNALLMFLFVAILAILADFFITKVVWKLVKFTKFQFDDKVIKIIHRPISLTILLLGSQYIIHSLPVSGRVLFFSQGILYSVLIVVWGVCLIKISNLIIENAIYKMADLTGLGREVIPLVENVWKVIILGGMLMLILSLWNVSITPLLASAGIVGAAVAFAAKDTIANFFGGISVFLDRPYKIGDYIVLDAGRRGEVVEIGIRSTRIKTRDDILISVPNALIANTTIINESAPVPNFRVRIPVGVAYGSHIDEVEQALLAVAHGNGNVLREPEPRVRFREFGDSSLNFELLCWVKEPALRGRTVHELNKAIYQKFEEKGIQIPFPQRDVHIHGKEGMNGIRI